MITIAILLDGVCGSVVPHVDSVLISDDVRIWCILDVFAGDFPALPVYTPFTYDGHGGAGVKQGFLAGVAPLFLGRGCGVHAVALARSIVCLFVPRTACWMT